MRDEGDENDGQDRLPAVDERTQTGFTDETTERVTEPDQPLENAELAKDVAGVPESVARSHEAEGLTTLDESIPADRDGRFGELMEKRKRIGLTDQEAAELGRLVAEREGQSYWSAQSSREKPDREA
jgi:hypothetical protein